MSQIWTKERLDYLARAYPVGTPIEAILQALNDMPGSPVTDAKAVQYGARRAGVSRPDGWSSTPRRAQRQVVRAPASAAAPTQRKPALRFGTVLPATLPTPPATPVQQQDDEARPNPLLASIYDYAISRRVRVNLVGRLTADDLRLINQTRDFDGLPRFPSPNFAGASR
ncbi:hypothetical protein ACI2KH_06165 [Roseomonas mucosa]|uniref:hypothetical protein n=1 Tax=Roseomonas mucosa TaxID=207340 RepID=UPI00384A879C